MALVQCGCDSLIDLLALLLATSCSSRFDYGF